jgi:ABC-type dipeptide/oligopeptide/nickel transport system permease subunit
VWSNELKREKKLVAALVLLTAFQSLILFAGFFAPYDFAAQDREQPFASPTALHFVDPRGNAHIRPCVQNLEDPGQSAKASRTDSLGCYPLHFFVRGAQYKIAGLFTSHVHLFGVQAPGHIFLMGSDAYGRDQLSRFLFGGQISMLAGLIAAILSVSIGIIVGGIAGHYGGWVDELLMRGGELFLALPWLYLLFAVSAASPHFAMGSISAVGFRDGADRLGSSCKANPRRGVERKAAQLCSRGPRIRSLRRVLITPARAAANVWSGDHTNDAADSVVCVSGSDADFPGAWGWRAHAELGQPVIKPAAVLRPFLLLVDVFARATFDSAIPRFLYGRRCAAGNSQDRHAIKTIKSL